MQKKKPLTLSWREVLWLIALGILVSWLFDRAGRFDLARPTMFSLGMVGLAIAKRWDLRRRVWFWITMTVIVVLHHHGDSACSVDHQVGACL